MTSLAHEASSFASLVTAELHHVEKQFAAAVNRFVAARLQATFSECGQPTIHHKPERFDKEPIRPYPGAQP